MERPKECQNNGDTMKTGKTIKQIAEEIGVSRQAVYKKIKTEPLSTSLQGLTALVDSRLTVSVDGEKLIKQAFLQEKPSTSVNQAVNQAVNQVDSLVDSLSTKLTEVDGQKNSIISVLQTTIDTLQGQLEVKDHQLATKDKQIEQQAQIIDRLTDALKAAQQTAAAAQALHAGTIQQQLEDRKKPSQAVSGQKKGFFLEWFRKRH